MHSKLWTDMFVLALPVAEKILRPIVVYFFLVIGLRLAGKRELAQLNPFDLVVLLTLSNTVQNAIIGDDNTVTGGIIGAATLLLVNYLVVRFLFRHEKLDRLVEGEATVLIEHGKILEDKLAKEMLIAPGTRSRRAQAGIRRPRRSGPRHARPQRHDFASPAKNPLRRKRGTGNCSTGSINSRAKSPRCGCETRPRHRERAFRVGSVHQTVRLRRPPVPQRRK